MPRLSYLLVLCLVAICAPACNPFAKPTPTTTTTTTPAVDPGIATVPNLQGVPAPGTQPAGTQPIAQPGNVGTGVPGRVNLIPFIDPQRDAVHGRWAVGDGKLLCSDQSFVPRVQIPYQPPAEYDFIVTFSQANLRNGVSLIMPNPNGGSFHWAIGGNSGSDYGFQAAPGVLAKLSGNQANLIQPNTEYTTTVQVRRAEVKAYLNMTLLVQHPTDFRDLVTDGWRRLNDTRLLGVACDDPTTFRYVQVQEIGAVGRRTR